MNLIIETDLGHDPDDFFTICYLAAAGVNIRAITIVPGDLDQVATAKFLLRELGLDIPVGVSNPLSQRRSSGGVHLHLLKKYKHPDHAKHDGGGRFVIRDTLEANPDCQILVIGPPTNIGRFLFDTVYKTMGPFQLTMQGGFLPYSLYRPKITLGKFEGKEAIQTFNMNGDIKATEKIVDSSQFYDIRFCGKNVCHTVLFSQEKLWNFNSPNSRAAELFLEAANFLFYKNRQEKKFHDPVAACCLLHPEIGTWIRGIPKRAAGQGWTTEFSLEGHAILGDLNHDRFWNHIYSWS